MNLNIDLSSQEIRKVGWQALRSQLGIARSLRFLQEYNKGEGDYTKERKEIYKNKSVDDIVEDMKKEGYV